MDSDLWSADLDAFEAALAEQWEKEEREMREAGNKIKAADKV